RGTRHFPPGRRSVATRRRPRTRRGRRRLADDVAGELVLAQSLPRWVAQPAVRRPLRELDLADELGTHPVGAPRARWPPRERRGRRLQRVETSAEIDRRLAGEAGADLADVVERSVRAVNAQQQRT